jgi:signal transduction histidine kinase
MTGLTVAWLGPQNKSLHDALESYDVTVQRMISPDKFTNFLSTNHVDLSVVVADHLANGQFEQILASGNSTGWIFFTRNIPEKLISNVYYVTPDLLASPDNINLFLHNLFASINLLNKREEFTAMVLHDTRSPINSIIGYLDLLETGIFGSLNEGQERILANVMVLGDSIIEMIDEINTVLQLNTARMETKSECFDFIRVLEEVLVSLWIQADDRDILIHRDVPESLPEVLADSMHIQRVLTNLVNNAIKYSPAKSKVSVRVTPKNSQLLEVSVSDQGPGIPEKYLDRVFDKFFRVNYRLVKDKGSGLGLFISKKLIEANGGTISVKNNFGSGCTFTFTIPFCSR